MKLILFYEPEVDTNGDLTTFLENFENSSSKECTIEIYDISKLDAIQFACNQSNTYFKNACISPIESNTRGRGFKIVLSKQSA